MVFETEEDFQTTLDFLNNADTEMLDDFEQILNYKSFRSVQKKLLGTENKYEDELFLTMINPDAKIIIAKHLMRIDFEQEKTLVFPINENNKALKSAVALNFDWDDDIFEYLESGNNYKKWPNWKYCRTNKAKYKEWRFWIGEPGLATKLKAKVCFQRYGIYNSIIMKFKADKKDGNAPDFYVHYKTEQGCFYTPRKRGTTEINREKHSIFRGTGNVISDRPYNRTRRLKAYYVNVKFDFNFTYGGKTNYYTKNLSINCSK